MAKLQSVEPQIADLANGWLKSYHLDYKLEQDALNTEIDKVTNCSIATVGRAIKTLKDDNWIDTVKIGTANAYCVNERAFWKAGRNQRKYAVFSATVIAAASEQESDYPEKAKEKLTFIPIIE